MAFATAPWPSAVAFKAFAWAAWPSAVALFCPSAVEPAWAPTPIAVVLDVLKGIGKLVLGSFFADGPPAELPAPKAALLLPAATLFAPTAVAMMPFAAAEKPIAVLLVCPAAPTPAERIGADRRVVLMRSRRTSLK